MPGNYCQVCLDKVEISEGVYIGRLSIQSCGLAEHAYDVSSNVGMVTAEASYCFHENMVVLTQMAVALTVTMFRAGDWSPTGIFGVQHIKFSSMLPTLCCICG